MKSKKLLTAAIAVAGLTICAESTSADVIMRVAHPEEQDACNIMVTFDTEFFSKGMELGEMVVPTGTFLGEVTYNPLIQPDNQVPTECLTPAISAVGEITLRSGNALSVAIGPNYPCTVPPGRDPSDSECSDPLPWGPTTREVKSPLWATFDSDDTDTTLPLVVEMELGQASPVFGFGLGFNDQLQFQNGSQTQRIGKVVLFDDNDKKIGTFPLKASRLFCCTEVRFDYAYCDHKRRNRGYVKRAKIIFDYEYVPFNPFNPSQEGPRFFGLDDVTFSTADAVCKTHRRGKREDDDDDD